MQFPTLELGLPDWVGEFVESSGIFHPSVEGRMRFAIELSRLNVRHGTGGPFGAAVFDQGTGELLAPGVNLVTSANCSMAHAEIVALTIAQQVSGSFDLGGPGKPRYELVASTDPCAMCLGATPWSGVRSLVCGASGEDAEEIGFDEGVKPEGWEQEFQKRGIAVKRAVLREAAATVLEEYAAMGGEIYNPRKGSS
ncbi:MAG: nucleoside deaminase [Actinomycetota bacterium]|nr:nucleoside deaminase [Actinomycetota bacterium]HZY64946.1 nucleoside deaminase [Rubrobacteraceae bacterium]